jgi:hypothetical protein
VHRSHRNSNQQQDPNRGVNVNITDANTDANTDTDANANADTNANANADANTNTNADADANTNAVTNAVTNAGTVTHAVERREYARGLQRTVR